MPYISKDHPCYFFTSVTHNRLPIFRTDALKKILCVALNEARISGKFNIYSYCIMPDHSHIVTGGELSPSATLRYLNGIAARRIIDHLKETNSASSLEKLRIPARGGDHKYTVWQHHANTYIVTSENMMMQKVNYVHRNPVEAGLVGAMEDYHFSSARYWLRKALLDDEPLEVDIRKLNWRA